MAKSALKELVEKTLSAGIREAQSVAVPKAKHNGGGKLVYNLAKREMHRLVNEVLPDTIETLAEVKPLCDVLDHIDFDDLTGDDRFVRELKTIIRSFRRRFLAEFEKLSNPPDGVQKETIPPPPLDEEQMTQVEYFDLDEEMYEKYITQRMINRLVDFHSLLDGIISLSHTKKNAIRKDKMEEGIVDLIAELESLIGTIKKLILERNPYGMVRSKDEQKIQIPTEEICEILYQKAVVLQEFLPLKIDDSDLHTAIRSFVIGLFDEAETLPEKVTKSEKEEIEDVELRSYVIRTTVRTSFEQVILKLRKELLAEENDLFVALVVDHLCEEKIVPSADTIRAYFGTNDGKEFLLDLAIEFNDKYHGGFEVRDEENLMAAIEKNMFLLGKVLEGKVSKIDDAQKDTEPPASDEDVTVSDMEQSCPNELNTRVATYVAWAKGFNKPGTQFHLKLCAAAGEALEKFGSALSETQIQVVLTLFEGLREEIEEREEGGKKRAIRVENLVDTILESLKAIPTKPETKGRIALEGLERKITTLENQIESLVIETKEIDSLKTSAAELEKMDEEWKKVLLDAKREYDEALKQLTAVTDTMKSATVGSREFTAAIRAMMESNATFEAKKVEYEGIQMKKRLNEDQWTVTLGKVEELESKRVRIAEIQQQLDRLITVIGNL